MMLARRVLIFGALVTVGALLFRWLLSSPPPLLAPGFDRRKGPGQEWNVNEHLDGATCTRAKQLRVCSHRGDGVEIGAGIASKAALQGLWAAGVSCFDADVLVTRDGILLVSHPDRLAELLTPTAPPDAASDPSRYDHAQLVEWGVEEDAVPRLSTVLRNFGALLRRQGMRYPPGYVPDVAQEPVILLDLKGAAFAAGPVTAAVQAAREAGLLRHTMFWCVEGHPRAGEFEAAVQKASRSVALIRSFPDRQLKSAGGKIITPSAKITKSIRDTYQAVGPALRVPDHFFLDAKAAGLPVFLWVVDDYPSLLKALKVGAAVAISNWPVAAHRALGEWQAQCAKVVEERG